jgi:hypothetical protein
LSRNADMRRVIFDIDIDVYIDESVRLSVCGEVGWRQVLSGPE